MESAVKLAGLGAAHAPQMLYSGARPPPSGPQTAHPPPTTRHDGSPYKTPISPPMASRAGAGGYPAYPAAGDSHVGGGGGLVTTGGRYLTTQGNPYVPYPREHYVRPATDRPMLLPHGPRRPTILGPYGPYSRAGADILWPYAHARADMMPMVPASISVSTTIDSSKRIKLSQPMKAESRMPLVIDTSDNHSSNRESTYNPQVEAISPTLPSDPRDESPLRSTKDDLLKLIEQVDRDIAKAESSIAKLRKKEGELEAAALKGDGAKTEEEDTKEPKHQSLAQIIYADNRKKAEESHNILDKLMPPSDAPTVLPLYHQPTDTEVYMSNKRQYAGFKRRLMEYFKRRHAEKNNRDSRLTQTYSKLMTEWLKKVEKVENSKKHKEKVAKNRELFEKVFPELRKQREEKERFSRVGARVKSDAEMEEIMDGLQEQENEDKKMRAYAVIPPILLDERRRKHRYDNKNGLIEEPIVEYKDHKNINIWTEQEREIFRDKYLQHPKNFVVIASYLERKSVSECIQYYYSTKKKENYKMLVKRRIRRRKPNNQPVVEVVGVNATGMTTRGSVAALQRGQQPPTSRPVTTITMTNTQGGPDDQPQNYSVADSPLPGASTCAISASASTPPATSPVPMPVGLNLTTGAVTSIASESFSVTNTNATPTSGSQEVREKDKENLSILDKPRDKPSRRERLLKDEDKTKDVQDSSDDDNAADHGKGGPHECMVCGTQLEHFGQSRPVAPGQAAQYGLTEAHLPPNPRVCTACRCRAVRRRVTQCPIPTCTTPKWRSKRLRPFPSRWADLPPHIKDPIIKEFQIPNDVTKCCPGCHNKITRKLGPDAEEPVDPSRWSEEDIDALRCALREVGCHWSKVAERLPNKTEGQCKSFYFNFKKKYKYDDVVAEYRKARGKGDGPPTVTDEEESGSSTSSCDEGGTVPPPPPGPDSASDTTSAPSPGLAHHNNIDEKRETSGPGEGVMKEPLPPAAQPSSSLREDYDSSATASADEGQSGVGRDSPDVQPLPHPGEKRVPPQPPPPHPKPPLPTVSTNSKPQEGGNVRELIYITIENSLKGEITPVPCNKSQSPPTIHSILRPSSYGRQVPPPPQPPPSQPSQPPPPGNREYHCDQRLQVPLRYNDPRAGLPSNDATNYDPQDAQCEGLDLSVRKRDRSPPHHSPHQSHPSHLQHSQHTQQSYQPPPSSAPPREVVPTMTVRGGAELTIAPKEPPRAHSNTTNYSKPPHEPWPYSDPRNKSPSTFISDSRSASHQPPSIMTSVVSSGTTPMVYTAHVRPQHPQSVKTKPAMAPPPPLTTVRSQHPSPQPVSTSSRISLKPDKQGPLHVGSITHGTPVNPPIVSVPLTQPTRFDMMPPKPGMGKEGGSITQGTPMHPDQKRSGGNIYKDGCVVFEPRPGSGVEIIPRPSVPYDRDPVYRPPRAPISSAPPTSTYPPYSNYPYPSRPPYSDSQISSRQIIATDYLTSQQMHNRRVTDKEARVSPRGRDHSPQRDPRDHRTLAGTTTVNRVIDSRSLDPRGVDIRTADHHRSVDLRSIDHRTLDPRMDPRGIDHRLIDLRSSDPRSAYYPAGGGHGSYAPSQPPSAPMYLPPDQRVSRPPPSPANRDATPTPPTSDPAPSPHDFRSPGVSTPTPPPRVAVIQRRPASKPPPHLAPPKSASPRTESDRYSPRHPQSSENFNTFVDIAVAQRGSVNYATGDRRDSRVHHDPRQIEGFEKQLTDSMRNSRSMDRDKHDVRAGPIDGRIPQAPAEDRRYYEARSEHERPRILTKNAEPKEDIENDAAKGLALCFKTDDSSKPTPSPKGSGSQGTEGLTAANLIDAIINHQIGHNSDGNSGSAASGGGGGSGSGGGSNTVSGGGSVVVNTVGSGSRGTGGNERIYRRENEGGLQIVELDKRVRSPAAAVAPPSKEKEVVIVEDESRPSNPHNPKELSSSTLHITSHHTGQPKSIQAHMDQIIHRELSSGDGRKMAAPHMPYTHGRPSFEILRTDGRPLVASGAPPAVTVSQVGYEPWKMRGHDKDGKERLESRSPHRPSTTTAPPSAHHLSAQHLAPDERQIIRIAQPLSPRPDRKMRTPPAVQAGSFTVEPVPSPTAAAQPTSDPNHTEADLHQWHIKKLPYQSHQGSKEVFEYVRSKIAEVMRTPDNQETEKCLLDDGRHPGSGTPVSQQQQQPPQQQSAPQQNAHYTIDDSSKKRRLETGEQRPPSRPRSTGGDMIKDRQEVIARDDVADSPQSGEMVIDESPRDAHPPSSKSSDTGSGGKGIPKGGESGERQSYPPTSGGPGSQYPYPYSTFRGAPVVGGPGVPPSTTTTTSSNASGGRHLQGYEPNVEPVSDED